MISDTPGEDVPSHKNIIVSQKLKAQLSATAFISAHKYLSTFKRCWFIFLFGVPQVINPKWLGKANVNQVFLPNVHFKLISGFTKLIMRS